MSPAGPPYRAFLREIQLLFRTGQGFYRVDQTRALHGGYDKAVKITGIGFTDNTAHGSVGAGKIVREKVLASLKLVVVGNQLHGRQ
jgi:hypothetical protein